MADSEASETRVRIAWVDYARGVGIFLVVLGHTLRGLRSSNILSDGPAFQFVDSWIYAFHMPLFFLLSGLFAERRVGRRAGEFLREIVGSIAYPYLIWSVIETLMHAALSRHTNHSTHPSQLLGILVTPILQFWFLYVLFWIYLIYYALRRLGFGPPATFAAFVGLWATQNFVGTGDWWAINLVRVNGIYFALGGLASRFGWVEGMGRARSTVLAASTLLGFGLVATAVDRFPGDDLDPGLKPAVALCGIAASAALASLLSRVRGLDFLRIMGVHSLEIYVAHTIASAGLRIILTKGLSLHDPAIHLVVGTVGGVVLPLLLSLFCRRSRAELLFRLPGKKASRTNVADIPR